MRKLKIMEHVSIDGVIQSSGEDGFPYADWTVPYRTPAGRDEVLAAHGPRFDLLLGRRTYDMWSDYWPKAPAGPMADGLNAATNRRRRGRGRAAHQVAGGAGPRAVGQFPLTSTLLAQGLADEVMLIVYPVLVGTGKRLFAQGTPGRAFELVGTKTTPSGLLLNTYKLAGALKAA
ncbi:hypothetical protein DdX_21129 [Ditylenchus destructor]|uniref:Bacterial bifunctional deaminase-reductase C-terminal domain-containing protein n=1 Tax=Ditylenchus destructor TaxID=166010 RepID=A0AAD4MFC1_9BILA|nr:hypothetical protein DdX_21129 [Ditylenchus destructor]